MACGGDLELVFPSNGKFDVIGISRFCAFALGRRLWPRFEWWGNLLAVRVNLGRDVDVAIEIIDACFGSIFHVVGPYALEFHRMGWQSAGQRTSSPSQDGR
jgi:hypothetical protein